MRSLNEYRRRDTLAYLGLRYYFHNRASRSDYWEWEVATDLVLSRTEAPYFAVSHFKETDAQGSVIHRLIHLPSANEALAEAVLLEECARRPAVFSNLQVTFSYALNVGGDRSGIFQPYIHGLRKRHKKIAQACEDCPDGIVRYADIRKFYPSITSELAIKTWRERCEVGRLPNRCYDVGGKLIANHAGVVGNESKGILTGPMFSHLLGNLVLRKIDEELSATLPAKYFRYVDDMVLVGEKGAVERSLGILQSRLQALGFELHDDNSPKSIEVSTGDWLLGRDDFSNTDNRAWPSLIEDLRLFLLLNPKQREALQSAFRSESLRIEMRDYSAVAQEHRFLTRVIRNAWRRWYRSKARALNIKALLQRASTLRDGYVREFRTRIDGAAGLSGFARKRTIPKLRYCARRLVYLADDPTLLELASAAAEVQELFLDSQVMKAVATGMIDDLLPLGSNAAQAAAQPLLAAGKRCLTTRAVDTDEREQALAVFFFNGVHLALPSGSPPAQSEILRFATSGSDMALMRSADPYIREIACLHGLSLSPRHPELLRTAFDEDEELFTDAIEQIQQSASP